MIKKDKKYTLEIIDKITDRELFLLVKYDDIKIYGYACDFSLNIPEDALDEITPKNEELIPINYFPPENHCRWSYHTENRCARRYIRSDVYKGRILYTDVFVYRDVFIYDKHYLKLIKARFKNTLLEFKYAFTLKKFITFDEALRMLHDASNEWIDNIRDGFEDIGVSINQILEQQLLILLNDHEINLYGVICIAGEKISDKKELIPAKCIPSTFPLSKYSWDKDSEGNNNFNYIYSAPGELTYAEISMKRRDFKRALGNYKKLLNRGLSNYYDEWREI